MRCRYRPVNPGKFPDSFAQAEQALHVAWGYRRVFPSSRADADVRVAIADLRAFGRNGGNLGIFP